jgi:hypothetical protein
MYTCMGSYDGEKFTHAIHSNVMVDHSLERARIAGFATYCRKRK